MGHLSPRDPLPHLGLPPTKRGKRFKLTTLFLRKNYFIKNLKNSQSALVYSGGCEGAQLPRSGSIPGSLTHRPSWSPSRSSKLSGQQTHVYWYTQSPNVHVWEPQTSRPKVVETRPSIESCIRPYNRCSYILSPCGGYSRWHFLYNWEESSTISKHYETSDWNPWEILKQLRWIASWHRLWSELRWWPPMSI